MQAKNNYAILLAASGDVEGARGLHKECAEAHLQVLGPLHALTLNAKMNLAKLLAEDGKTIDARHVLEEVVDGYTTVRFARTHASSILLETES